MAQASLYGVVEKIEYERADGKYVRKLSLSLSSVLTVNITYFDKSEEYFMHINKKKSEKIYYLPLSWGEAGDVAEVLKAKFTQKDLEWLKDNAEQERESTLAIKQEVRMHPYQRAQRLPPHQQQQQQQQQQQPIPQQQIPQQQQQVPQQQQQVPQQQQQQIPQQMMQSQALEDFVFY